MSKSRTGTLRTTLGVPALVLLLASLVVGSVAIFVSEPIAASSSPNFSISRTYFSTAAKTTRVGFLTCDCQGNENLRLGRTTPYFTENVEGFCSPF